MEFRLGKQIRAIFGNATIQLTTEQVMINGNGKKKLELINLDEVDEIMVMKNYSFPDETITDLKKMIAGQPKKNAIILQQDGENRTFYFEFDSYYSIIQLEKLMKQWQLKGYPIVHKDESYFNNIAKPTKSIAS